MNARGRAAVGSSALLLGTVMWLLVWSRFGPAVDDGQPGHRVWQIADALSLSYRLAAIALGVGGLLLATRGWRRGAFIALGLGLGWLGLDAILAAALTPAAGTAPDSQPGFVVVTNTLAAGVVAAVVAIAGLVLVGSAQRQSVLLVVTAVASADLTGNRRGAGPAVAAAATALIAAVLAVALSRWQLRPVSPGQADLRALLTYAVLGAGVLVLAWLCGHSLAGWPGRVAGVLVVIGSPAVFAAATWGVLYLYLETVVVLRPFTEAPGRFGLFDGALPLVPIGVFAGGALALLCLLPQALSTPDIFGGPAPSPAPSPAPPPPADAAGPRAPVAIPGVPEILEHPLPAVPRR